VDWDPQSKMSLERNVKNLNMVIPEWFFIDNNGDSLRTNIDTSALRIMRSSHVKIVPILSNAEDQMFKTTGLHRILNDPNKRANFINQVIKQLELNHFDGINVDFEELKEKKNEILTNFSKELYDQLHSKGFIVTQNVSPFNEDYDYVALAKNNDLLFLMAYDQYSNVNEPGPISTQKWIEAAVDNIAAKIPSDKIVLNLAAYGYDFGKDSVKNVTYQEALLLARRSGAHIDFGDDTYNLHFSYQDNDSNQHQVYFTDAATNFNTMRFAAEYGLAGTAIWRLGSEDNRLWDFYASSMTKAALKSFDFHRLERLKTSDKNVDYVGDERGEILDVVSSPAQGKIKFELDSSAYLISEENYVELPSNYIIQRSGQKDSKKLVLTFDDGPDPTWTPMILDTLKKYNVPASFFMLGSMAENDIPLVKKIYDEGYEIGNHTFTHPNIANVSSRRALLEMDATRLVLECITGHSTILFRPPFNADAEPTTMEELEPVYLSRTRNYLMIGENIDPEDWQQSDDTVSAKVNADTIFNRVLRLQPQGNIILLHDAGGDRRETVKALGMIIRYFKARGFEFTTIGYLMGKNRNQLMPVVPKDEGYGIIQTNMFIAKMVYYFNSYFFAMLIVFLILNLLRVLVIYTLAKLDKRKERKRQYMTIDSTAPYVSIIVPAHNEEVNAVSSLQHLIQTSYPNFEVIFVDDGSSDATYEKVNDAFKNNPQVRVFTKTNGGKASALNFGIGHAHSDFVVCIDADTQLQEDAISLMMRHFNNQNVGAVAGAVKVGNERNLITIWQSIEYTISQNFDRRAFDYINAITVVPGAIGVFRKDALLEAGGFTTDTLAEDCDLTIRILKCGYLVENESAAKAYTEAPETTRQFLKQRFRWSFGVMQTWWKNRDILFSKQHKGLGWFAFPDILLFKYIVPLFAPFADIIMIFGLFFGNADSAKKIGIYYIVFLIVDALISFVAFAFEKEKAWKLIWIIPQRLIYRWLMLWVLFKSILYVFKGELQGWGSLKRTGNVKMEEVK
ncbi:MAG: glycosyl transferase family 2, partial [Pseudopedobacter saltans]